LRKQILQQFTFLRALASLSICIFHIYCGNSNLFPEENFLKSIFAYGYLGVHLFFMISGFIICYSLPNNYNYVDALSFFKKRFIRIEPPYIASIFLLLALNVVASLFTRNTIEFNWINLIFHLGYLNNFGLGNYYNVVYWTLGIEFQFYLLLGLLLPLFNRSKTGIFLFIIGLAIGTVIPTGSKELIFPYLSIFGLGIVTYYFKYLKLLHKSSYWILTLLLFGLIYYNLGLAILAVCIIGLLVIHFYRYQHTVINFFSRISYSLYLIHVPIGGKIVNFGIRYAHTNIQKYMLVVIAISISIFASYIFYLIVEKPFVIISKKIIYSNTSAANSTAS